MSAPVKTHEIVEWASASDLIEPLSHTGLGQTAIESALQCEANERKSAIISAVVARASLIKNELLKEVRMTDAVLAWDSKSRDVAPVITPYDATRSFQPFSMVTRHFTFGEVDENYFSLRDSAAELLYGASTNKSRSEIRIDRTTLARALKPIIKLANPRLDRHAWDSNAREEALAAGFEIHPGLGITFLDPAKIRKAIENNMAGYNIPPKSRKALLHFLQRLTEG